MSVPPAPFGFQAPRGPAVPQALPALQPLAAHPWRSVAPTTSRNAAPSPGSPAGLIPPRTSCGLAGRRALDVRLVKRRLTHLEGLKHIAQLAHLESLSLAAVCGVRSIPRPERALAMRLERLATPGQQRIPQRRHPGGRSPTTRPSPASVRASMTGPGTGTTPHSQAELLKTLENLQRNTDAIGAIRGASSGSSSLRVAPCSGTLSVCTSGSSTSS